MSGEKEVNRHKKKRTNGKSLPLKRLENVANEVKKRLSSDVIFHAITPRSTRQKKKDMKQHENLHSL